MVGGGDVVALELEDAGDFLDLFGVGAGFLSARDVERVFEADADVAAHQRGGAGDAHLLGASADGRPLVVVAEEFVGGLFHEDEVIEFGSDAAEDAHDELQEDGRLEVALVKAEFQVVEVADVVAFVFKFYVVRGAAELLGDHANVGEGVAEDVALGGAHVVFFPALLPALVALGQRVDGEVHRSHVQAAHFGAEALRGGDALGDGHYGVASGGDVDDGIGGLANARQEELEVRWVYRGGAVLRVTRVQVDDGGASLSSSNGLLGDGLRAYWQGLGHGGGVYGASDGAGDDGCGHS